MQSHPDVDASSSILDELRRVAAERMKDGSSGITAGHPGEEEIASELVGHVFVRQLPNDPLALRISIGEANAAGDSAYLVFRGNPSDIMELLERSTAALRASHFAGLAPTSPPLWRRAGDCQR